MQRTHFTVGYTLYNYVCDKLKKKVYYLLIYFILFYIKPVSNYGKMLKYWETDISADL